MSKKSKFIEFVNNNLFIDIDASTIDPDVMTYWEALISKDESEKPKFTDNGKLILKYLQTLPADSPALKAKDIAEGMDISSRSVSGAMRKLTEDGYVERVGKDPILYLITENGKNVNFED